MDDTNFVRYLFDGGGIWYCRVQLEYTSKYSPFSTAKTVIDENLPTRPNSLERPVGVYIYDKPVKLQFSVEETLILTHWVILPTAMFLIP